MLFLRIQKTFFFIFVFCVSSARSEESTDDSQVGLNRPYLTVIGCANLADGIGRQTVEIIGAFKDEVSVGFIPTKPVIPRDIPKSICEILEMPNRTLGRVIIFEDVIWYPNYSPYTLLGSPKKKDQIRIAYSMFESTRLPAEWPTILNEYFDAVAVPDSFLIDVYKQSGVTIPIFELPLGLELEHLLCRPLKKRIGTPFIFANYSSPDYRKNQKLLVQAFAELFGNNSHVQLRINSRWVSENVAEIKKLITDLKVYNIRYTQYCLDSQAYLNYFSDVDCYVSLSKGEGFSIQPREAMALGIPVIVTDNTAQTTICRSQLVRAVPSFIKQPGYYADGFVHGDFFECSLEDVKSALLDVYMNYEHFLSDAEKARNWVRQYSYKNLMARYRNLIVPKKIFLGDEDKITDEFFMTTSQELYEKYLNLAEGM